MKKLSRREFLRSAGAGALSAAGGALLARSHRVRAAAGKPNFLFILVDDLGWKDLGCYGSTFYETPNSDRIAREGMRFTDAYAACPVCSPTRASIMTGKYPARVGITDYIAGRRRGKLIPPNYLLYLPHEEVTIAEALKEAGYATFFAGKWHLGQSKYWPEKQGFDVNKGGCDRGGPYGGKKYFSPYGNPRLKDGPPGEHLPDRLASEAAGFIEASKDRPFLTYLSFYSVHTPLMARADLKRKYQAKAKAVKHTGPRFIREGSRQARQVQDHAVYGGMVEAMDQAVGKVLGALDRLGLADRTVVFFMSDNGGLSTSEGSPTSNAPLRAGKGWLYEGGIREPMMVRWPGVAKPGSTCPTPVTSTDFYPTMLEMAGLAMRPRQHADGVSLVPLLKRAGKLAREAIYWHYPHYGNQGGSPGGAVRSGDWKLIEFYEDDHVELYNLRTDIGEKTDLSAREPGRAAELRKMLHEWRKSVGAKMPKPNPNYKKRSKRR